MTEQYLLPAGGTAGSVGLRGGRVAGGGCVELRLSSGHLLVAALLRGRLMELAVLLAGNKTQPDILDNFLYDIAMVVHILMLLQGSNHLLHIFKFLPFLPYVCVFLHFLGEISLCRSSILLFEFVCPMGCWLADVQSGQHFYKWLVLTCLSGIKTGLPSSMPSEYAMLLYDLSGRIDVYFSACVVGRPRWSCVWLQATLDIPVQCCRRISDVCLCVRLESQSNQFLAYQLMMVARRNSQSFFGQQLYCIWQVAISYRGRMVSVLSYQSQRCLFQCMYHYPAMDMVWNHRSSEYNFVLGHLSQTHIQCVSMVISPKPLLFNK